MSDLSAPADPATGRLHPLLAARPAGAAPRRVRPSRALAAVYRALLRNQATRGRLTVVVALGAIVALVAGLAPGETHLDALEAGTRFINGVGLSLLVPVVSLVFASAALGDLVDDQTLVYLWLPPVPRWIVPVAAWLSAVTICLPFVAVPLVVAAVASGGGGYLIEGIAVSSALGVVAYSGLFTALGLRFRRALLWGLAYLLLWENFIARAGAGVARLSVLSYLRSLLSAYTGVGLDLADRSLPASYLAPPALVVVSLAYAARRLARQDVA